MVIEYLIEDQEVLEKIKDYQYDKQAKRVLRQVIDKNIWIISYEIAGENRKSADALSSIHIDITQSFHVTTLVNESSAYYNTRLFPHANLLERKLRKLLYIANAISDIDKHTIHDLESLDFGQLFMMLFTDTKLSKEIKKQIVESNWPLLKSEAIAKIDSMPETILWDILVGNDAVGQLKKQYLDVKDYRNDIMHAHNIDKATYEKIETLFVSINTQLDEEIEKRMTAMRVNEQQYSSEYMNTAFREALIELEKATKINQERMIESISQSLIDMRDAMSKITGSTIIGN